MALISVIVAVRNSAATLAQCIDSFVRQTLPDKELIVVDGVSTDGSLELLEARRGDIAQLVSEPDTGIYNAWNKGLALARGEWICFIGSDDYFWDEQVLSRLAPRLDALPEDIQVAYGSIQRFGNDGKPLRVDGAPWEQLRERFRRRFMCIPHPATLQRASLFRRHGGFDESFRIAGDYELLLRELTTGDAAFIPGLIVAGVRAGGISTNPANTLRALQETRRAQRMHGQWLPSRELSLAILRERSRLFMRRLRARRARSGG